jgi:hypothetical protein
MIPGIEQYLRQQERMAKESRRRSSARAETAKGRLDEGGGGALAPALHRMEACTRCGDGGRATQMYFTETGLVCIGCFSG